MKSISIIILLITFIASNIFSQKEKWNEEQAELKPHNEQPSDQSKVYLLLVSFGIMILIYILDFQYKIICKMFVVRNRSPKRSSITYTSLELY